MNKKVLCIYSVFFTFCCAGMNDIKICTSKAQKQMFSALLERYKISGLMDAVHRLKKGELAADVASRLQSVIDFVGIDCQQQQELDSDGFDRLNSMASSAIEQFVELYKKNKKSNKFNKSYSKLIKQVDPIIREQIDD